MPTIIPLPAIKTHSGILLEEALRLRCSKRSGWKKTISATEISHLLFAAYGRTDSKMAGLVGYRHTVPSAGATYPLEIFVEIKSADKIPAGIYKYDPKRHRLELQKEGDYSDILAHACQKQQFVCGAPACIIIMADFYRTKLRYKDRGVRYVHMEAGSAYQNISLEAVNLGLGTVVVGAFDDGEIMEILGTKLEPLCVLPVG